jgi:hypothetical protein
VEIDSGRLLIKKMQAAISIGLHGNTVVRAGKKCGINGRLESKLPEESRLSTNVCFGSIPATEYTTW